jgi:predicted RNase H-like HicB family nuclease
MSQTFASTQESDESALHLEQTTEESKTIFRNSYEVTIEKGQDGWLIAKCPTLNVVTQGKDKKELEKNIIDAVSLMLEELGKPKEFTIITKSK